MKLNRVGFVGWRGMVGSVLLERMLQEDDFSIIDEPLFFTTSQAGQAGPDIGRGAGELVDATDTDTLMTLDAIVTCQGGDYTSDIHTKLRSAGWQGYWIDAASTLRMADTSEIILDPVNLSVIEDGLKGGKKDFIGGNCTVSLMLMALDGILSANLVEWMTVMTYQAISGGGARQMRELIEQMGVLNNASADLLSDKGSAILDIDKVVIDTIRGDALPKGEINYPLAGNLLPWIDKDLDSGTSREEWKGAVETNKILGLQSNPIPIESTNANQWTHVVPNEREATLTDLTPAKVTGTLAVPIGRIRKLHMGEDYMSAFTVGDQLLWGAAEPLRRMLRILHEHDS